MKRNKKLEKISLWKREDASEKRKAKLKPEISI